MGLRIFLFAVIVACAFAFAERVAVLETTADAGVISNSEKEYITDKLRGEAGRALPASKGFVIMTRENTQVLLQGKSLADCEGSCAVETGANLEADYVVSSRVGKYGKNLTLTVDLYEVKTKKMLGSITAQKKDAPGLLEEVEKNAFALFKKALKEDDVRSKNFVGIANIVNANESFDMTGSAYYLVDFITTPEGASVVVNYERGGRCDETPCSLELQKGNYQGKIEKPHYLEKSVTITVNGNTTVRESLESNFGTVVIAPKLMSQMGSVSDLTIELDGTETDEGSLMVEPGRHRVNVSHPCYRTKEYAFNIERNGTYRIEERLEPANARLVVNSDDARGTPVYVNGRQVGKIPYSGNVPVCAEVAIGEEREALPVTLEANRTTTYNYQNSFIDQRDGHKYKIAKIGGQTWMAENLNYSMNPYYQSWCYDNKDFECSKYGRLYTWAAAVGKSEQQCGDGNSCNLRGQVQGVCPAGWHLPSKEEFDNLLDYVGGKKVAGTKLKSSRGWVGNGNGDDSFGFTALPVGYRYDSGYFHNVGNDAVFWSSTEHSKKRAYFLHLFYSYEYATRYYNDKINGFSVRCLKN